MEHRSRRGSVLFILLFSVVLVGGAIASLVSVEQARSSASRTDCERQRAFALAESATDTVAVLLGANAWPAGTTLDWSSDGVDNDGDGLADEGDESLVARADLWWSDGIDNDGDGATDETDEGVARVTSAVGIGTSRATVTGWVRRLSTVIPLEVPGVVNLFDPNARISFKGNSFSIDGRDRLLTGGWGTKPSVYGIATNGSKTSLLSQLSKQQLDNVTGAGGRPSVTTWSPSSPDFVQTVVDAMSTQADVTFRNYGSTYTGSLGDAKAGKYLVTYSKGDLKIGGGSTGAGALCVDGDLEISGKWEFVGPVFVTGSVTVKGGGSGQKLLGAMFVGGDFKQILDLTAVIKGGIELIYSASAIAAVTLGGARFDVVAVTEP
jgi:hypothetical protein